MEFSSCINDDSFGPSVHGCRGDFDFTLRFEKIVLSILPSSIFIALSVVRVAYLVRKPVIVGGSIFQYIKLTANAIFAILQLSLLALSSVISVNPAVLLIPSSALNFTSALCICFLTFLEHSRSPRPSILLNAFLFLTILFDIAQTRSMWLSIYNLHDLSFVSFVRLFTTVTAWKAVLILLESRQKQSWILWDQKTHSPEELGGIYTLGSFSWLNSLFFSGYSKVLTVSDLFALDKNISAEFLQGSFSQQIEQLSFHEKKHGLAMALAKTLAIPCLLPIAPRIALLGFAFCQPLLLQALLNYLEEPETNNKGYGLIGATILVYTGIPVMTALYWYFQERALYMTRAYLAAAIYWKTTQIEVSAADDSAALTYMSTDVERIRMGFMQLHEFWANPIQVALACWLLKRQLGAAFAAPIIVVLICVICSTVLMRFIGPRQRDWMEKIQKRVGHTANVISNMKQLKVSGLAAPVEGVIQGLRVDELQVGGKFRALLVMSAGIGFTPVLLAPVFTFAVTSRNLDVTTIFTSISYLLLLSEPLSTLFQIVPQFFAALSCLQRIQAFLEKESRHDFRHNKATQPSEKSSSSTPVSPTIKITKGSFGWDKKNFILKDIDCSIPSGLTIVIGPVASGKSTFCKALLGETPATQGTVTMCTNFSKVGYCDQVPFLLNKSIRDNIIGFSPVDEKRYAEVISATMLTHDLLLLPGGDRTKIGSNGTALSGGQKHRVAIARALYLFCDLLVFDDVLSGLDSGTEEQVFLRVFGPTGLLKKRGVTAVLCTHSTHHLPMADHIIALGSDSTIAEEGNFEELIAKQQYVHSLGVNSRSSMPSFGSSALSPEKEAESTPTKTVKSAAQASAQDSTRAMGDFTVFRYYFRSIGTMWLLNFAFFGVICGFFYSFPTIWLKYWSEDLSSSQPQRSTSFYIGLYALFQCLGLGALVIEAMIGLLVIIKISGANLHKSALQTIITAPLRFFSTTDTGVITNLFSQDMTLIDTELPQALTNLSLQSWIGIGTAAVIVTSSPYVLIVYPFIVALLYGIQKFYLRTSRQLRLLDLEAKSPLYTNFLDTIRGVATFRAFDWSEDAISLNNILLDTSQRPAYLLSMVQRWLSFVLGMVVAILAVIVVTLSTQLRSDMGFTGASMVSIMSFGKTLASLIQMYTLLETSIGAVRRLKSFSENTDPEDLPGEDLIPPSSWPEQGRIEIRGVSASYNHPQSSTSSTPENLALQNLTFKIEPGQKVAICGRTGSGKSSIVLLLMRLLDPVSGTSNNMTIDGLLLHKINRSFLRERIIAVPQEPVFLPDGFSFKSNLDPLASATDDECQAVFDIVGLWALVSNRGGLASEMTPESLSQGQKQLFNLARAILRRRVRTRELVADIGEEYLPRLSSVGAQEVEPEGGMSYRVDSPVKGNGLLILDEFSSNVDMETDKTMREIVRREFEGYTILMVSHRLEMVMESDRVLVMDNGMLLEEGKPSELVEEKGSRFKTLWEVGKSL